MKLDIAKFFPSEEELNQLMEERRKQRDNPTPHQSMLRETTTLSKWIERCQQLEVDQVPAEFGPSILVDDMWEALDGKDAPTLLAASQWLAQRYVPGANMWRWEHCAPLDLKSNMAHKRPITDEVKLCVDDPRMMDIVADVNVAETRLCVRPIYNPAFHDGYPVEFRCYVFPTGGVAVSNYYPQMSLPESYLPQAKEAGALAYGFLPMPHLVKSGFTADFLLMKDGRLVFLEGGPPWGSGSHPCCFEGSSPEPGKIALSPLTSRDSQ